MAHALRQAWSRQSPGSDWQCLAPEAHEALYKGQALYLLGLDWQTQTATGREPDDGPTAVHQRWRERLTCEALHYVVLYGNPARQWQQLAQSLRMHAPGSDWSWLPANPAQGSARLRPLGCEQCSHPECERRLFDALRSGRP